MNFQIISDGSCDFDEYLAKVHDVKIVPFYVSFDGEKYLKENVDISIKEFYEVMTNDPTVFPKSSLPSVQDYIETFTPYVKDEIPVICICITTKFSGSYNSALNAKNIVLETYPNAKIAVINSTVNTVLQGLFVMEAAKMRNAGLTYEEAVNKLEEIKSTGRIIFTIGSIDYLQHGGRIGKLKGLAASILKLKPIIMLKEGEIFPLGITRKRNSSLKSLIEHTREHFKSLNESADDYSICVGAATNFDEADAFRDELLKDVQTYSKIDKIPIYQIGAAIGVHTGPNALGIGLIRKFNV